MLQVGYDNTEKNQPVETELNGRKYRLGVEFESTTRYTL